MNKRISGEKLLVIIFLFIFLTACNGLLEDGESSALKATGTAEATEVVVSAELGGRVAEVLAGEGDPVEMGEPLLRISDQFLEEQRRQAEAALETAEAGVASAQAAVVAAESGLGPVEVALTAANTAVHSAEANVEVAEAARATAQAGFEVANVQHRMVIVNARQLEEPNRIAALNLELPGEFVLPSWYLQKTELVQAAEFEASSAEAALEAERENLQAMMTEPRFQNLLDAEERLAEARAAFLVAEELLDREISGDESANVSDYAQDLYDAALAELEAAQSDLEQIFTEPAGAEILEARGRLAAATERLAIANNRLYALYTGDESLEVLASEMSLRQAETLVGQAEAQVQQAEAALQQAQTGVNLAEANMAQAEAQVEQVRTGVEQAEKVVEQAQAALNLIDAQVEKLTVYAAVSGTILDRLVEPGEVVGPGTGLMTIGQLDELKVVVYVPENRYGEVDLGNQVTLTADSFPGESFTGVVTRIADRAEYTPRNVQTAEERQTTVYAIEVTVDDTSGRLKPGMPVDVEFNS